MRDTRYEPLAPHANGTFKSEVFPEFWLSVQHLLSNDFAEAVKVLQLGLSSPEHAAFVQQLAAKRA
ncbi:MAG: hypothetical protein WBD40_06900 [Tepidisphaeraceae bacterium]